MTALSSFQFRLQKTLLLAASVGIVLASGHFSAAVAQSGQRAAPAVPALPAPGEMREVKNLPTQLLVADIQIEGNRGINTSRILSQIVTRKGRPFDSDIVQSDVRKLYHLGWFSNVSPLYEDTPQGRIVIFRVTERPTIRYIQFLGAKKIKIKKLEEQVGLKRGDTIDPYRVEEGRNRLEEFYKSKGYNRVQVVIEEGDTVNDRGVVYVINEGVHQRLWNVKFEGNKFVSSRRLKTQIQSKPSLLKYFGFGGDVHKKKIDDDVQRLTAYYRAFGFFQAKVGRILDFDDKGKSLTLRFIIHEGPRYRVRRVSFIGNELFDENAMMKALKLQPGNEFEQAKMLADQSWLQDLYGSKGYVFADIKAEPRYLEAPGQIDLVYRIDAGKRWRVGRIFVHIGGDNPHTKIQTALNRLTLRPGDIMDIRQIKSSERRLRASGLYLTDAAKGIVPKISYVIPKDQKEQFAKRPNSKFRGQSPTRHTAKRPTSPPQEGAVQEGAVQLHVYLQDKPAEKQSVDPTNAQPKQNVLPAYQGLFSTQHQSPTDQTHYHAAAKPTYGPRVLQVTASNSQPSSERTEPQTIVRGQNSGSGAYAPAYSAPTNGNQGYGGRAVGATGPASAPVRAAQNDSNIRLAQGQSPAFDPIVPVGPNSPPPLTPNGDIHEFPNRGPLPYLAPPVGAAGGVGYYNEPLADIIINAEEAQTGRFMAGASVNSNLGVFGSFVIDERNFDIGRWPKSWEDIRNGTAWRGAGQRFRFEAAPGSSVNRYLVSFQEPYLFGSPISLGLSGSFFDRRYQDWDEQRLGGRVSLGYQWTNRDLATTFSYRGERVNIRNPASPTPPDLANALGNNYLHGFRVAITNDTRDSAFLATTGHFAEISFEQVLGTYDYPRASMNFRQYYLLSERPDRSGRHVLSFSTLLSYTGTQTPIYEHYFAGGFTSLRGYRFRGASPVDGIVRVGGEFEWINSAEYLFPLTADDMIHGVVFCDFGTVEKTVSINDFRVAPGFGLRISVPAMGPAPIALDFAFPVASAATDDKQTFSFHIGLQRSR